VEDDELAAVALAADPSVEVGPDAVSIWSIDPTMTGPLPEWYMPQPMLRGHGDVLRGWRRRVVYIVIAAFVTISAYGLCNTYGQLAR
jgi:hypothetical protein